jgi:hypothetical protein
LGSDLFIVYLKLYVVENQQGFFSRKLRAGKRRTYFFDVRSTKQGDYFVTITESKRRFDRPGYDSHKIFLYKEDFTKFGEALQETLHHIKTELNPDFDYDAYDRETYQAQVDEFDEDDDFEKPAKLYKKEEQIHTAPKSLIEDKSDISLNEEDVMEW